MTDVGIITTGLGIAAGLVGLGAIAWEAQFRRRPGNALLLTPGEWNLDVYEPDRYVLVGDVEFRNLTERLEIMVPHVEAEVTLLSKDSLDGITHRIWVMPKHADAPARADGYWFGYIVKVGKTTHAEVTLEIKGPDLSSLQAAWVRIHYITYGPQGRIPKVRHVMVPLKFPSSEDSHRWRPTAAADVLPIRTHLLTHLDDPVTVVKRYVMPHAQPGDVVTIGETPVAIMQDRFHHPSEIKPGWLAKRLCYYFLPTSSLATACGMQTLVNIVGPWRVAGAFLLGAIAKKFLKKPGLFYQLAGEQARLIDDVTGTLPPYDQFIVLGPENPQQVVDQIKRETGLAAAIVDVNDLKAVKVLAATAGLTDEFLTQALISNPAGNADEQTPVVLIRPVKS
ncbi:F420-0:Gamma-glutamyl ligase [Thermoleptolyngbya sichuanensis XZ-Cy5]|uniref:F420-0:Gamma-glutamyl ligase n=1 Tax=Thermoleptolyngbya sichuanensis TaxID=2885951 RepID=UPI00240DC32F|nr:F420-0:Gamma-glutamyl ligase [Thermoleptolyngbya sichuanensis]MDG2617873.1 F420-0:Gamma-glutamyl ligase [Thermoleptolyngbya sichuanensis XZ-Cy5]